MRFRGLDFIYIYIFTQLSTADYGIYLFSFGTETSAPCVFPSVPQEQRSVPQPCPFARLQAADSEPGLTAATSERSVPRAGNSPSNTGLAPDHSQQEGFSPPLSHFPAPKPRSPQPPEKSPRAAAEPAQPWRCLEEQEGLLLSWGVAGHAPGSKENTAKTNLPGLNQNPFPFR